jgi:hypothetical protein
MKTTLNLLETFPASANRKPTTASRILETLQARQGEWVSLPTLAEAGKTYAVHSRISELRQAGHIILWRCSTKSKTRLSEYQLVIPPTE